MDDPIQDISPVIHSLTQGSPNEQKATLEKYFTEDASFYHPFCRVDSFAGSRSWILGIYRWYKFLSPRIELEVQSVAYDEVKQILYVTIRQVFALWFLFGLHSADVVLTTKLQLTKKNGKYYIQSQNDLYQTEEFMKFASVPWGIGGYLVIAWQWFATFQSVLGAFVFSFFTAGQQWYADHGKEQIEQARKKNVSQLASEAKESLLGSAQQARKRVGNNVNGAKAGGTQRFGDLQVVDTK